MGAPRKAQCVRCWIKPPSKRYRSNGRWMERPSRREGERAGDIKSCQSLHGHRSCITQCHWPFHCVGTCRAPAVSSCRACCCSFGVRMTEKRGMVKVSEHCRGSRCSGQVSIPNFNMTGPPQTMDRIKIRESFVSLNASLLLPFRTPSALIKKKQKTNN